MIQLLQILSATLFAFTVPNSVSLTIDNITSPQGSLMVAVFAGEEDFPDADKSVWKKVVPIENLESLTLTIPDLSTGKYAIAVFHDVNENRKLDKTWVGIPKEPYGFSGDAVAKWSAPSFVEAAFNYDGTEQVIVITLKEWSEH